MTWTAPRTWTDGETVTAVEMNAHVRDNLKAIGDAWAAYTPTFTNLTLGASTVTGNYMQAGKLVHTRGSITLGTGFAITGTVQASLPVSAIATAVPIGSAGLFDTSATDYRWWNAVVTPGGTATVIFSDPAHARVNATVPWTWAVGDVIRWETEYESA